MSLLYRAEQWLTIAQLVPAWANELAGANSSTSQVEGDLWHYLREDVINGLFDDSGPLRNGSRLGLRVIDHRSSQPPYVAGRLLFGKMHLPFRSKGDHILAAKEAVLNFARRREVPPPSWWSDATKGGSELSRAPEELKPAPGTAWYDRPRDVSKPSRSPEELEPAPAAAWFNRPKGVSEPSRSPEELKPAPDAIINQEIRFVYADADAAGTKRPNIKELPAAVHPLLEQKGFRASGRRIQQLGEAPEFKRCRRPPGKTVASEQRKK